MTSGRGTRSPGGEAHEAPARAPAQHGYRVRDSGSNVEGRGGSDDGGGELASRVDAARAALRDHGRRIRAVESALHSMPPPARWEYREQQHTAPAGTGFGAAGRGVVSMPQAPAVTSGRAAVQRPLVQPAQREERQRVRAPPAREERASPAASAVTGPVEGRRGGSAHGTSPIARPVPSAAGPVPASWTSSPAPVPMRVVGGGEGSAPPSGTPSVAPQLPAQRGEGTVADRNVAARPIPAGARAVPAPWTSPHASAVVGGGERSALPSNTPSVASQMHGEARDGTGAVSEQPEARRARWEAPDNGVDRSISSSARAVPGLLGSASAAQPVGASNTDTHGEVGMERGVGEGEGSDASWVGASVDSQGASSTGDGAGAACKPAEAHGGALPNGDDTAAVPASCAGRIGPASSAWPAIAPEVAGAARSEDPQSEDGMEGGGGGGREDGGGGSEHVSERQGVTLQADGVAGDVEGAVYEPAEALQARGEAPDHGRFSPAACAVPAPSTSAVATPWVTEAVHGEEPQGTEAMGHWRALDERLQEVAQRQGQLASSLEAQRSQCSRLASEVEGLTRTEGYV